MFNLDFAETDTRLFVPNKKELAAVLGCDLSTVSRMLDEPGNPGREIGNVYSVQKWRDYFSSRGNIPAGTEAAAVIDSAKVRERVAKAALAEIALQKARGDLLEGELEAVRNFASRLREVVKREIVVNGTNAVAAEFAFDRAQTGRLYEILNHIYGSICDAVSAGATVFEDRARTKPQESTMSVMPQ